ncbi:L-arabinose transport system permease protein AraP [Poriferisphaera corsica]|uniref:L-arabinose transport system permease protein AraP n=1 Tax=Poriferisphaera corsica TaxID=2528020 RepID=A0A517YXG5_9BACT|nr:extracellular solute-binding protein [Poriferisphaera corsica]QDU34909.1 L-arabinose transport system permease protein AraP [Poriferisphaera corsica]
MTVGKALRSLLVLATILIVIWAFIDVGVRIVNKNAKLNQPGKTVLTILHWGNTEETDIVKELVREFEAENPDIKVNRLHANDYDTKLKTMLAAGTPPDLFYLRYEDVIDFADTEMIKNLEPFIAKDRANNNGYAMTDEFYPILIDAFRFDKDKQVQGQGDLYGIAKDFTTWIMYVNLDLFKQAGIEIPYDGWTWDEYRAAMKKIRALSDPQDPNKQYFGGVLKTWPTVVRNILWTNDADYFGGENNNDFNLVTLDQPNAQHMLNLIRTMRMDDDSVYNPTGISQSEDDMFRRGKIGSIGPLGRWMTPQYRKITEFDWDIVPMPYKTKPVSDIATVSWAMASATQNPDKAYTLLKFLTGKKGQTLTSELGLAMPCMKAVAESDAFLSPGQKPKNAQLFIDMIAKSKLPQNPRIKKFTTIVDRELQKTLQLNEKTPMQAANDVSENWRKELASPLNNKQYSRMPWMPVVTTAAILIAAAIAVLWWIARKEKLGSLDHAQERTGYLFVSPWVLGFVLLVLGPMILSFILAFTQWSAMSPLSSAKFVGFDNFVHIFNFDKDFTQSLWVTAYFTIICVPVIQVAALLVALLMNVSAKGIAFFRTAYFVPSVVTGVALVTLWITIFNNDSGMLNAYLNKILIPLGLEAPDWFGEDAKWFAMPALVIMSLWGVGGGMVIYLAGLKGIPQSLYEAATIDGAGPVKKFFAVTMPMLSPLIFFNLVMGIIGSFQIFTQAYVIRGSSGGTNENLMFYVLNLYDAAFNQHRMGYASALAWILFIIILVMTLLVFRGSKNMVHYEGLKS